MKLVFKLMINIIFTLIALAVVDFIALLFCLASGSLWGLLAIIVGDIVAITVSITYTIMKHRDDALVIKD